jgi:raffinose/stachyose/melibiose transport system substrate-binding protein
VATALAALVLAGCGTGGDSGELEQAGGQEAPAGSDAAQAPAEGEQVTLSMTTWRPLSSPEAQTMQEINEMFSEENPGVTVELQSIPPNEYEQVMATRFASGTPPDALVVFGGGSMRQNLVKEGYLADLSEEEWVSRLTDTAKENMLLGGGTLYSLPLDMSLYGFVYYNADLFEQNGIAPPDTWSGFLDAAAQLREAGVIPLALGGKDEYPMVFLQTSMLGTAIGRDEPEFFRERFAGDTTFAESRGWNEMLDQMLALHRDGVLDPNVMGVTYEQSMQLFTQGQAGMIIDSNVAYANIEAQQPTFEVGAVPFAFLSDDPEDLWITGVTDSAFVAPAEGPNLEIVKDLMAFYARQDIAQKYAEEFDIISPFTDVDSSEFIDPLFQPYLEMADSEQTWLGCNWVVPAGWHQTLSSQEGRAYTGAPVTTADILTEMDRVYDEGRSKISDSDFC